MSSTMAYPSILKEGVAEVAEADKTDERRDADKGAKEIAENEVAEPPKK